MSLNCSLLGDKIELIQQKNGIVTRIRFTVEEWEKLQEEITEQLRGERMRRTYYRQNGNMVTSDPFMFEDENARDVWGFEEEMVEDSSRNEPASTQWEEDENARDAWSGEELRALYDAMELATDNKDAEKKE